MALGKDALSFEGSGYWSFQALGQRDEIGSSAGGAESQIQKRTAAGGEQAAGLFKAG
jgi:hypothetical protein